MKKKSICYLMFIIVSFAACQSDSTHEDSTDSLAEVESKQSMATEPVSLPYLVSWNDQTQTMEVKKTPGIEPTNLTTQEILIAVNNKYSETRLEWVKQQGDTAYVKIADAVFLTQQSGSEGARAYLLEVTYGLTEIPGITAVDFAFAEGDHATPGVYTRESFEGYN